MIIYGFKPYDYGGSTRWQKKKQNTDFGPDSSSDTRWRSVKIRPGMAPCRPIAEITGQIFLAQDAPSLPLKNCTRKDCRCRYVFLEDRRSGEDRRLEIERLSGFLPNLDRDRRHITGRRYADLAA
jgi:hypothetical protein